MKKLQKVFLLLLFLTLQLFHFRNLINVKMLLECLPTFKSLQPKWGKSSALYLAKKHNSSIKISILALLRKEDHMTKIKFWI